MRIFLTLSLLLISSQFANAEGLPTYLCKGSNGAIYLRLDINNQASVGRESNPFTTNLDILKKANPSLNESNQFTNLHVVRVKQIFSDFDKRRPVCSDCYYLNFSPLSLSGVPDSTLDATKSVLSKVAGTTGQPAIMLKVYTGNLDNTTNNMYCDKLN